MLARNQFRFPDADTPARHLAADFAEIYTSERDAVLVIAPDSFRIASGNELACRLLQYALDELKSLWLRELFPPADADFVLAELQEQARLEGLTQPIPLRRKDGIIFYVNFEIRRSHLGAHTYWLLVLRDVERPKPLTEALMIRDLAMAACANGIAIADMRMPDQPLIYVNPAFERLTGYSAEEILGRNCRFLQGEHRDQPGSRKIREAIAAGKEVMVILRNYRKDGSPFWNELHLSPVYNANGIITHFIGVQNDVSYKVEYYREVLGQEPPGLES